MWYLVDSGEQKHIGTAIRVEIVLVIDTIPVKGEVFLDDLSLGIAPTMVKVGLGTYQVSFGDVEGYFTPQARSITLTQADIGKMITVSVTYQQIEEEAGIPWGLIAGAGLAGLMIVLSTRKEGK